MGGAPWGCAAVLSLRLGRQRARDDADALRLNRVQTQKQTEYVGLEHETWKLARKATQRNPFYKQIDFPLDKSIIGESYE